MWVCIVEQSNSHYGTFALFSRPTFAVVCATSRADDASNATGERDLPSAGIKIAAKQAGSGAATVCTPDVQAPKGSERKSIGSIVRTPGKNVSRTIAGAHLEPWRWKRKETRPRRTSVLRATGETQLFSFSFHIFLINANVLSRKISPRLTIFFFPPFFLQILFLPAMRGNRSIVCFMILWLCFWLKLKKKKTVIQRISIWKSRSQFFFGERR